MLNLISKIDVEGDRNGPAIMISKSTYLQGLQCSKLLWTRYNAKKELPATDEAQQALFDQGAEVGRLAKLLFPGGIEIEHRSAYEFAIILQKSKEALSHRKPLFEAAFAIEGGYARADILNPVGEDEWEIIEVKSSTKEKDVHLHDLAFQRHIFTGAGLKITRTKLLLINNTYSRSGEIETSSLFHFVDVTAEVNRLSGSVGKKIEQMLAVIKATDLPGIEIGRHCSDPYECPLKPKCWSFLPEHNVFTLIRGGKKAWNLFERGVYSLTSIAPDVPLSEYQQKQLATVRRGEPHLNIEEIQQFLDGLEFPLHFLDFETIGTAIPLFDGSRPYQQVPFQYSLHILRSFDADPEHREFLADSSTDPRLAFLQGLKRDLQDDGSIVTYNATFEKQRLKELAGLYPDGNDWIEVVLGRIRDLYDVFRSFSYYHPQQKGSTSIKAVLPVLTGKSYDALEVQDGGMATRLFLEILSGTYGSDVVKLGQARNKLLEYCRLDTEGMVLIFRALVMELKKVKPLEA